MSEPILSTNEDRLKFNNMIDEIVASKIRQEDEASFQKDVLARAKDELGIEGKFVRQLVSERMKGKLSELIDEAQAVVDLNEQLLTVAKNARTY